MLRELYLPHLGKTVKLGGCILKPNYSPRLKLKDYLNHEKLPAPPQAVNYTAAAISVIQNVEGNDQYGDCVLAEDAHYIAVVTGNAGALYSYTQAQTLADYTALTGFNPNNPSTDQGADPIQDLNWRITTGYADGSKDIGWAQCDGSNQAEIEFAVAECGNLKFWGGLPDAWINPFPSSNGFVWDVAPIDQNNGHCMGCGGYNVVATSQQGVLIYTWGLWGWMTWAAFAAFTSSTNGGGCAVRLTQDWCNKQSGLTVPGLALSDLVTDVNTLFGSGIPVPVNPTPPAPPSPNPTPTPGPTLQNVNAWIAAGINTEKLPFLGKNTAIQLAQQSVQKNWAAQQKAQSRFYAGFKK
jgi:hypothetical protein